MQDHGYNMQVEDVVDFNSIKVRYNIPASLQSCHTAIVDGYIVEGHVPVEDVERLLTERPDIAGIAVPGMPAGSPGMELESGETQPYDVLAFDASGNVVEVFARYTN